MPRRGAVSGMSLTAQRVFVLCAEKGRPVKAKEIVERFGYGCSPSSIKKYWPEQKPELDVDDKGRFFVRDEELEKLMVKIDSSSGRVRQTEGAKS